MLFFAQDCDPLRQLYYPVDSPHFFVFFLFCGFIVVICTQLIDAYKQSEYFCYGDLDNRLPLDNDRL